MPRTKGSSGKTFAEKYDAMIERGRALVRDTVTDDGLIAEKPEEIAAEKDMGQFAVDPGNDDTLYHCNGCGYEGLTRGVSSCPRCGAGLDWSGVE